MTITVEPFVFVFDYFLLTKLTFISYSHLEPQNASSRSNMNTETK
jgi:hypothetical protein